MSITKTVENQETVISLSGRLDSNTSADFQKELEPVWEAGDTDIVINMEELNYISSAGLRILLLAEKKCKANKRHLTIKGANQSICEIFDITGFSGILTIVE